MTPVCKTNNGTWKRPIWKRKPSFRRPFLLASMLIFGRAHGYSMEHFIKMFWVEKWWDFPFRFFFFPVLLYIYWRVPCSHQRKNHVPKVPTSIFTPWGWGHLKSYHSQISTTKMMSLSRKPLDSTSDLETHVPQSSFGCKFLELE